MGRFKGEAIVVIDAPLDVVYAAAADIEAATSWRPGLKQAECLEHGADGEQLLVRTVSESQGNPVRSTLRHTFAAPASITWTQVEGDLPASDGSWTFAAVGTKTRATYNVSLDLGKLGLFIRGPLADKLRGRIVDDAASGFKMHVESRRSA